MQITPEKIDEGLAYAGETIASMEGVDFDELADSGSFQKQYGEAAVVVVKMLSILDQAPLAIEQRIALSLLVERYNRCAIKVTQDMLDHCAEEIRLPGRLN
jgi:hypothetical protein